MSNQYIITTFYKFADIEDVESIRAALYKHCYQNEILGTILLANEGVNATIVAKTREAVNNFYSFVENIKELSGMTYKETFCDYPPFSKLKVKIKPEIIKICVPDLNIQQDTGKHLNWKEWEDLIDKGVTMIDTRNEYEIAFGTFKGAIDPHTNNFTDIAAYLEHTLRHTDRSEPIAMYCTGGVRCEKSTALLTKMGFKNVYHLDGGIIQYLIDSPNKKDYWLGSCFVFDDRVAITHDLAPLALE